MKYAAAVAAVMALQSFTVIDHPELSAEIATQTARAIVQMQNAPAPKPVSGQCKTCLGTGVLGDGAKIKITCQACNGNGKEPVSVLVKPKAPCTNGKCPL
jgi:DnaJ-class molecular chaperone